jgi:arsenical pump membrane protein
MICPVMVRVATAAAGAIGFVTAVFLAPDETGDALSHTWSPFVLVAGLLAVGVMAHREGLFDALGHHLSGLGRSPIAVLSSALMVVAVTTAVLNLDTAAAFLTPVVILAARRRRLPVEPFMYGALVMTNAASLLLPGSNLTNLLVLGHEHVSGARFTARMAPGWVAAVAATLLVVTVRWRASLQGAADVTDREGAPRVSWLAAIVVVVTALLVVATSSPAIAVAAVGLGAVAVAMRRGGLNARAIYDAVDPLVLMGLFGIAVALGTLARTWDGPSRLLGSANRPTTMVVAALATVVINNLPAAALFGARSIPHPRALLLGLNLGPNLAVTGSLSAFVWIKAARSVGARPDWRTVTAIGVVLVPLSLAAAGLATHLLAPSGW